MIRIKHIAIAVMAFLLTPFFIQADSFTLEEAFTLARSSNSEIESAQLDLISAQRTATIDENLPSLSLSGGLSASGGLLGNNTWSPSLNIGSEIGIGVRFSFLDGKQFTQDSRSLSVESAVTSLDNAILNADKQLMSLYWNLEAQILNCESLEKSLQNAKETHQADIVKYDNGLLDELSLKQSELAYYSAEQNHQEALLELASARKSLEDFIGTTVSDDLEPLLTIRKLKDQDNFKAQIAKSISIRQAQTSLSASQISYESSLYEATNPSLSLSTSIGLSASYRTSTGFSVSDSMSVSLSISVPTDRWFVNSSASANLDNLQRNIQKAELTRDKAVSETEEAIANCYESIESCIRKAPILTKTLELRKEAQNLTQLAYDAGNETYSNLRNSIEAVFQAEIAILQNQLNFTIYVHTVALQLGVEVNELFE